MWFTTYDKRFWWYVINTESIINKHSLNFLWFTTFWLKHTHMHKKEAYGPHRSPDKQFQSINTILQSHDYTITLIKRKKNYNLLFENWIDLICKYLSPLHPRMLSAKFGWNWPSGLKKNLNFVNVTLFRFYLLLEQGMVHQLNNPEFLSQKCPLTQWCFVPIKFGRN